MSNAELKLKASSLGLKNYLRVSPEVLEKAVLAQEFINQFKEEENEEMLTKLTSIIGEIGETAITIPNESVLDEILSLCSESSSVNEDKEEEIASSDNEEEKVVIKKEKKQKVIAVKKEKTTDVEKGPGVIASILEFIKEAPYNRIEILAKLKTRFPDRDEEAMSKTLKVQIEGKSPTRLEKEKNIKLTVAGEGVTRTYNVC